MIAIRAARPSDAAELIRLRRLMFRAMRGRDEPGTWERSAEESVRRQPAEPGGRLGAFVVAGEAEPGGRLGAFVVAGEA
ncbi:GNAT family N-acetyltransferase, partial [Streptomyces sp. NPDC005271]